MSSFWASDEQLAPAVETLILTFSAPQPVNFVDFQIGLKPIAVAINYWTGGDPTTGTWAPVTLRTDVPNILDFGYDASFQNPWGYGYGYFELVTTPQLQLVFTRQTAAFPFTDSTPFPFSIDVKNLRLSYIVTTTDDFQVDQALDVLGNPYQTQLFEFSPDSVADDEDDLTYWQSQPNPSRFGVECLYFDLRTSSDDDEPVVVDEVFLDPLTTGVVMHIYTSNDSVEQTWDYKLWTPVPHHFILAQGYYAFPAPIACKYVKLEFTQLTPMPYNTLAYPTPPPVIWRKFPSWILTEMSQLYPNPNPNETFTNPYEVVTVDPLSLGFLTPTDGLNMTLDALSYTPEILLQPQDDPSQLAQFISATNEQTQAAQAQAQMKTQINFNSPEVWQTDLSKLLDPTYALDRQVLDDISIADINTNPFQNEDPLIDLPAPDTQSVADLTSAAMEKTAPINWFPRICRHQYQMVSSPRPNQVAYFVGLKTVTFYRRNYSVSAPYDIPHYIELLLDDENIEYNDLTQDPMNPWRYI